MTRVGERVAGVAELSFSSSGHVHVSSTRPAGAPVEVDHFHHVDDRLIALPFGDTLRPELADLVDVAMAVSVADRLVRRRAPESGPYADAWWRRLRLRVPLRNPGRWQEESLATRLSSVLWFFTEDEWEFEFVPRNGPHRPSELQRPLLALPLRPPISVALFSGGLDSFAGLWHEHLSRGCGSRVLVSAQTSTRASDRQRRLVRAARARLGLDIVHVQVPFGLRRNGTGFDADEPTQRARGFVFLSLGAATALMAGAGSLSVYENGLGAINLPYTAAQLGSQSTRATHPAALDAMGELISLATERRLVLRLPFLGATKASLVSSLARDGGAEFVAKTISCDGFPQRVAGTPQCGACTSCILRRLSIYEAGLGAYDRQGEYRFDVLGSVERIPDARWHHFRAMQQQVFRLQEALAQSSPWRGLSVAFPQLIEVAGTETARRALGGAVEDSLVDLYRRYCDEWWHFVGHAPPLPVPDGCEGGRR